MKRMIIAVVALALTGCTSPWSSPAVNPDPNHTHADFAVWVNGKKLDFSDARYMSGTSTDGDSHPTEGSRKYLHLHDGKDNVIHRHKPGLTLKDFLTSFQVGFSPTGDCYESYEPMADGQVCGEHPFRMFVNGVEMPFDTGYVFKDLDRILITNTVDAAALQKELAGMTDDACLYSKTCTERGDPPAENCVADPEVPCTE